MSCHAIGIASSRLVSSCIVLHRLASLSAPCVAFPESSLAAFAISIHWPSRGAPHTGSTRRLSLPETPSSHSLVSCCSVQLQWQAGAASEKRGPARPSFSAQAQARIRPNGAATRSLAMIKCLVDGRCYCDAMPDSYYRTSTRMLLLIQVGYLHVLYSHPCRPVYPPTPAMVSGAGSNSQVRTRQRRGMDLFSVLVAPFSPIPRPRDP